ASIAPAVARGIPILVKNSLNPVAAGTCISKRSAPSELGAKGISSVSGVTLFTVRWLSIAAVRNVAERLFRALAAQNVDVLLISQASSEQTICFAVNTAGAPTVLQTIQNEFQFERQRKLIEVEEKPDQSVVAVVGDGMRARPGVSGKIFG